MAVAGGFDPDFLQVPAPVLIAAMRDHQKYFHVLDANGHLLAHFITVANIDSPEPQRVRAGNERVLRARLADARYFWDSDRRQPLIERSAGLAGVVYEQRLGTLADKTLRVERLAGLLAGEIGADAAHTVRAARLAKADLLTLMVGEFPELQGDMGAYYADHDGEPAAVCTAIREHYLPRHAGDDLPASPEGLALALADRLDTLAGIVGVAGTPGGDRDPFGLRRAALAVARMLIEAQLPLDLPALLDAAAEPFGKPRPAGAGVRVHPRSPAGLLRGAGLQGRRTGRRAEPQTGPAAGSGPAPAGGGGLSKPARGWQPDRRQQAHREHPGQGRRGACERPHRPGAVRITRRNGAAGRAHRLRTEPPRRWRTGAITPRCAGSWPRCADRWTHFSMPSW